MSEQTVQHRTGPRMRKAATEVDPFSEGAETVRESVAEEIGETLNAAEEIGETLNAAEEIGETLNAAAELSAEAGSEGISPEVLDEDDIVVQAKPLPAGDYALIETAPTSGVIVYVSEDAENYVKAAWHATRRMHQGRWTPSGWWIDPLTRTRIEMHPIVWRPADTSL